MVTKAFGSISSVKHCQLEPSWLFLSVRNSEESDFHHESVKFYLVVLYFFQSRNRPERSAALLSQRMSRSNRTAPHPSDYAYALSAYNFPPAVFLPVLSLWSSLSARRVSHHTFHSFLTLVFFERIKSKLRPPHPTADSSLLRMRGRVFATCRSPTKT